MYEKIALLLSISVAVGGVVGPFITGFMNNRHQIKLIDIKNKQEIEKEQIFYKRTIRENYLIYAKQLCLNHHDTQTRNNYGHWYSLALLYFPTEICEEINKVNEILISYNPANADRAIDDLAKQIHFDDF